MMASPYHNHHHRTLLLSIVFSRRQWISTIWLALLCFFCGKQMLLVQGYPSQAGSCHSGLDGSLLVSAEHDEDPQGSLSYGGYEVVLDGTVLLDSDNHNSITLQGSFDDDVLTEMGIGLIHTVELRLKEQEESLDAPTRREDWFRGFLFRLEVLVDEDLDDADNISQDSNSNNNNIDNNIVIFADDDSMNNNRRIDEVTVTSRSDLELTAANSFFLTDEQIIEAQILPSDGDRFFREGFTSCQAHISAVCHINPKNKHNVSASFEFSQEAKLRLEVTAVAEANNRNAWYFSSYIINVANSNNNATQADNVPPELDTSTNLSSNTTSFSEFPTSSPTINHKNPMATPIIQSLSPSIVSAELPTSIPTIVHENPTFMPSTTSSPPSIAPSVIAPNNETLLPQMSNTSASTSSTTSNITNNETSLSSPSSSSTYHLTWCSVSFVSQSIIVLYFLA